MAVTTDEVTIVELFAGYGGLGLGVEAALGGDIRVAYVSEIEAAANRILAARFPDAPNLGDVTAVDWTTIDRITLAYLILCAGFPCQDVSNAGLRKGLHDGTRSGLWHETARAIEELVPDLVVLENVRGLLSARGERASADLESAWATRDLATNLTTWIDQRHARAVRENRSDDARALAGRRGRVVRRHRKAVGRARRADRRIVRAIGTVLGTLAELGFDAEWTGLRAADVGAPHGRFRIFVLAWPAGSTNAARLRHDRPRRARDGRTGPPHGSLLPTPRATDGDKGGPGQRGSSGDLMLPSAAALLGTPQARDGKGEGKDSRLERAAAKGHVEAQVRLLPTPAVNDMGDGKTVEWWDEWAPRQKSWDGKPAPHGSSLAIEAQRMLPTPVTDPDAGNGHARDLSGEARLLPTPTTMDSRSSGSGQDPTDTHNPGTTLTDATVRQPDRWGQYADAIHRWEHLTGRPAPDPTQPSTKGSPQLAPPFVEWMMGLPAGWVTDLGLTRNEALKALGNGVVPQQAAAAVAHLLDRAFGPEADS